MPDIKKVWCLGMPPMIEEFNSHELECIGGTSSLPQFDQKQLTYDELDDYELDPEVGCVVQGLDHSINNSKLAIALKYVQKCGKWVVTNEDTCGVTQIGNRLPGNGMYVAALEYGLKRPDGNGLICEKVCAGKPNPVVIDIIRKEHSIPDSDLNKMVMIGDNPATDIALANNAGIASCLVMSGVV